MLLLRHCISSVGTQYIVFPHVAVTALYQFCRNTIHCIPTCCCYGTVSVLSEHNTLQHSCPAQLAQHVPPVPVTHNTSHLFPLNTTRRTCSCYTQHVPPVPVTHNTSHLFLLHTTPLANLQLPAELNVFAAKNNAMIVAGQFLYLSV
jgi:hypothetical protein